MASNPPDPPIPAPAPDGAPPAARRPRGTPRQLPTVPPRTVAPVAASPPRTPPAFPNYLQMTMRAPMAVWYAGRVVSVSVALLIGVTLFVRPALGLAIFWQFAIPFLPLVFLIAPGLWRNLCPMATLNQLPRLLGFGRGLTQTQALKEYSYLIGIGLFLTLVIARKVVFNGNGPALGVLILVMLASPLVLGLVFKGKSGWCSSVCPLLPVQRIYGQTPFVTLRNAHCQPCVGCTKNCYDFNPRVAYLADLYDDDPHYSGYRKLFVGLFPGLVLAFYSLPTVSDRPLLALLAHFAVYLGASAGFFFFLSSLLRVTAAKITALFAAAAFTFYYWYNLPLLLRNLGGLAGLPVPASLDWAARGVIVALAVVWIARTYRTERRFLAQSLAMLPVQVGSGGLLAAHQAAQGGKPEVAIEGEGRRIAVTPGISLLEVIEGGGLPIESGCRMGMCGADPVAVLAGMEHLSPLGDDERTTLERLGLSGNARLACCARVRGPVTVALKPQRAAAAAQSAVDEAHGDPAIARVVILGNGIAGVTAADHVRRLHATCAIDLVGSERHYLYNRMGISRLIYGRSAMQGLHLLPETWYDEHHITTWLNTQATRIDLERREVAIGTGEMLPYDRLILAMGSRSAVPPTPGGDLDGIFVLREADDAMQVRAYAQRQGCRRAMVVGGGLLGLEAAYALHKLGLHVAVLERSERVLRRQLDARASHFLQTYLEGLGLEIVLRASVAEFVGEGRVREGLLTDGRRVPGDIALICAGIVPNSALAREAGLAVGEGVIVDERMQTNASDVFAAGDVAEFDKRVTGLWPVAVEQAEVAARNALGHERAYRGLVPPTGLKVVGVELASIGRFEPTGQDDEEVIALEDPVEGRYRKLVIVAGVIVGAILLGYPQEVPAVAAAIKLRRDVRQHLSALRGGEWQVLAGEATASQAV